MKYNEMINQIAKQTEMEKFNCSKPSDGWSVPIAFVKTEEHNNHGILHQNNIRWDLLSDNSFSLGFIWYTQFSGPFLIKDEIVNGLIYFKGEKPRPISEITSEEMDILFSRSKFKMRERMGSRLKSRYNLLLIDEKLSLIEKLKSIDKDQLNQYFEYGGRLIDLMEV